jgi:hypothetical protein
MNPKTGMFIDDNDRESKIMALFTNILDIQAYSIEAIVSDWWLTVGQKQLYFDLQLVRRNYGQVLRTDHTYKVVKMIGAHSSNMNTWVNFRFIKIDLKFEFKIDFNFQ